MPACTPLELLHVVKAEERSLSGIDSRQQTPQSPTVFCGKTTDFATTAIMAYVRQSQILANGNFPGPWHVEICPTSVCPIGCTFCSYTDRNKAGLTLSDDKLCEVISDAQQLRAIGLYFSGAGDPFAKDIARHVEHAATSCGVAIQTNAIGMQSILRHGPAWFNANVDLISWSIYAHTPELFKTVCRGTESQFSRIIENIRLAAAYRDSVRGTGGATNELPPVHLSGKIVIGRENFSAIRELVAFARSFFLDTYHVRLVDNYEPAQDVALRAQELAELSNLIVGSDDDLLLRLAVMLNTDTEESSECPAYSVLNGLNAIVEASGEVFVSIPSDGDLRFSIGNVLRTPLRKLWGSTRHEDVIRRLSRAPRPPLLKDRHRKFDLAIQAFLSGKHSFSWGPDLLSSYNFRLHQRAQI